MGANTPRAGWVTGGTKKVSPKVWGARLMPYSAPPDRKHSLNPVDDQSRPGILRVRCNIKTLSTARTTNGAQPLTCSWVVSAAAGSNIYIYIYIYIYIAKFHREVLKLANVLEQIHMVANTKITKIIKKSLEITRT